MSEHTCSCPGCYNTDDDGTMYREETPHNEKGWMAVCGRHLSRKKVEEGKVTVIDQNRAADAANALTVAALADE